MFRFFSRKTAPKQFWDRYGYDFWFGTCHESDKSTCKISAFHLKSSRKYQQLSVTLRSTDNPNATKFDKMRPYKTKYDQMRPNATKCDKMGQNATKMRQKCDKMRQNATKCDKMRQKCDKKYLIAQCSFLARFNSFKALLWKLYPKMINRKF